MLDYPPRLSLAQLPTPIQPLERFNSELTGGNRLWVKRDDLTHCAASGNKIRKLEFTLAEAKAAGADVIITCGGVQSNHARATAVLGAQLGFKVHLILRGEPEELNFQGNHFLDVVCGATVECHKSSVFVPEFERLRAEAEALYQSQGLKTFFIPIGASDATGVWAYIKACEEIKNHTDQSGIPFDHIVCATGSGGTLAGLNAGVALYGLGSQVWGVNVCDDAAYFEKKSRQDLIDWQQKYQTDLDLDKIHIRVLDGYVGRGYARAEPEIYALIHNLASKEGLIFDQIYTGKAFYGLLQELEKQRFGAGQNILFIHTGGLFGLLSENQPVWLKPQ